MFDTLYAIQYSTDGGKTWAMVKSTDSPFGKGMACTACYFNHRDAEKACITAKDGFIKMMDGTIYTDMIKKDIQFRVVSYKAQEGE